MADDGGDAGTDDNTPLESLDDDLGDRNVPKWLKSGTWCCSILLGLPVLYFFVYPALAMLFYKALGEPDPAPALLNNSVVPIVWMCERNEIYGNYISWLDELMT